LVSWVVQGDSVVSAAGETDGGVVVVDLLGAASLVVDVDLGGSAAAGSNVGVVVVDGDVLGEIDDLSAWAGLLIGVVEGKVVSWVALVDFDVQAALVVDLVVGLVLEDGTDGLGLVGTAKVVVGVVALVTAALEVVVVVLGEEVSEAAELGGGVEGLEVAALSVGWASDVELDGGDHDVLGATAAAAFDLLEGANLLGAASLLGGIVASASTASKGVVAVLGDDVSGTADLSVRVEGSEGVVLAAAEGGSVGDLALVEGDGDFVSVSVGVGDGFGDGAASLLGLIERGVAAALEGAVVAADNAWAIRVTAAKLSVWIKSLVAAALSVVALSVGNDVEVGGDGDVVAGGNLGVDGGAAQVGGGVEGLGVATAFLVVVAVGEDVASAANLVGAVESAGATAGEGRVNGSVFEVGNAVVTERAALFVVSQELVATTIVAVVFVAENGINAAKVGGGVV
jgi:hypothetical protein